MPASRQRALNLICTSLYRRQARKSDSCGDRGLAVELRLPRDQPQTNSTDMRTTLCNSVPERSASPRTARAAGKAPHNPAERKIATFMQQAGQIRFVRSPVPRPWSLESQLMPRYHCSSQYRLLPFSLDGGLISLSGQCFIAVDTVV